MSDLMKLFKREVEPFEVKAVPINQCYQCTIDDDFTDVRQFAQLVDYLNNAQEGDIAHIKMSTNGGALHAIIPLIEAMRNTDAYIAMHVESDTASAGTILMMLANEVYINPYTTIMIHTASYGFYGHSGNMDANVSHSTKAIHRLVGEVYAGFLTPHEITRVLDGKEFYLTAEEAMDRFAKREEAIKNAIEEATKPTVTKTTKGTRNKRVKDVQEQPVE
jgi:ATP-dependent protease ClpP protease subunit